MSVQIVNLHNTKHYDFRCDRQSPVGHLYLMDTEYDRDIVCEEYFDLFDQIMHDPSFDDNGKACGMTSTFKEFREYINRIVEYHKQHGSVTLACWCSPKRCCCETIKQWILNPW
jgi:hypothetical protein